VLLNKYLLVNPQSYGVLMNLMIFGSDREENLMLKKWMNGTKLNLNQLVESTSSNSMSVETEESMPLTTKEVSNSEMVLTVVKTTNATLLKKLELLGLKLLITLVLLKMSLTVLTVMSIMSILLIQPNLSTTLTLIMETISEVMVGLQCLLLVFHTLLLVLRMVEFFTSIMMEIFSTEMVFLSLLQTETLGLRLP